MKVLSLFSILFSVFSVLSVVHKKTQFYFDSLMRLLTFLKFDDHLIFELICVLFLLFPDRWAKKQSRFVFSINC